MGLVQVTAPGAALLTVDQAKRHLRVDLADDNALIDALVQAVGAHVEHTTGRALMTQRWRLTLDAFPSSGMIRLPRPPLQSVESVTYLDTDGATQTLDAGAYVVDTAQLPGAIVLASGSSWPPTGTHPAAVTVTYLAGYGDADQVPPAIVAAAKLVLGDLYANREARFVGTIQTENPAVAALLGPYRYLEAV